MPTLYAMHLLGTVSGAFLFTILFSAVEGNRNCYNIWGNVCNYESYPRIKDDQNRLLACSYYCQPDSWNTCWINEDKLSPCVRFATSYPGRCHNGVCITKLSTYNELKRKSFNTARVCERGYDYLSDNEGIYGCKYYCSDRTRAIVNEPDGNKCQDPVRARSGVCRGGYCQPY
ncbi:uncharacterized protein LOC135386348 [Ornithodoros turicata]|uniref:uncharacterized protein LOC135386348 n=1 Tax=Ornithodoros turicata TaxID=34597 RepID=UPI003139CDED